MTIKGTAALLALLAATPSALSSQVPERTVRASTEYERSRLWQIFFGDTWRDVWASEITVPVLDLGSYAGGLEPTKTGGNQSRTLRFRGADGREYIFRSTKKDVQRSALPADLRHTPVGAAIQDETSAMHPSGSLVASVVQDALGILHVKPKAVIMPDDPRLGEFREEFRNVLGQIEERPDEAEKGTTFAGAEKIISMDDLLVNLEESTEDRFASTEYLKARLTDFIIGDTDRGADQWRWAKIESGERDVYRPIPRDRDYAFMHVGGLLVRLGSLAYPKLTRYRDEFPKLSTLVFMTRDFDRSQLVSVSPEQWDSVVTFIQTHLTDDVIDRAVAQLPPAHLELSGAQIESGLRARRDHLPEIAREFYMMVNEDADIFMTDEDERADIERHPDGSVTVRLWGEDGGDATDGDHAPVFERRFDPSETAEIRVYLERGNDRAFVHGSAPESIEVRVTGGEGDDVLVDSSRVAGGNETHFYDASGTNTFVTGPGTRVIRTPFVTAQPKCTLDPEDECEAEVPRKIEEERRGRPQDLMNDASDYIASKTRSIETRTWGKTTGWRPLIGYREGNGIVIGLGPTTTDYGFRRQPYETRIALHGIVSPQTGNLAVQLTADSHFETTPAALSLFAHASQLEANRFFDFGNATEFRAPSESLVRRDELLVQPAIHWTPHYTTHIAFGPIARLASVEGSDTNFGQIGAQLTIDFDRTSPNPIQQSGVALHLGVTGYPEAWDVTSAFQAMDALARFYVPVGSATVAFRAGGRRVWGEGFPLWDAAFVGGNASLRGYSYNRFAGDASAYGGAELRIPMTRITLLTRGELSIIALADAGRVWMNGVSEGTWHTSTGGGLSFASLGQAISATYAKGEEGRFYFAVGLPF